MKLDIRSRTIELSPEIDQLIRHRVKYSLGRFVNRLRGVSVKLEDIRKISSNGCGLDLGIIIPLRDKSELNLSSFRLLVEAGNLGLQNISFRLLPCMCPNG